MLMLFHLRIFVPCSAILHTNLFSPWVTAKLSQLASFRKKARCRQQDHLLQILSRLERSDMIQNKFFSLPQLLPHRYLCPYICHNIHQDRPHLQHSVAKNLLEAALSPFHHFGHRKLTSTQGQQGHQRVEGDVDQGLGCKHIAVAL